MTSNLPAILPANAKQNKRVTINAVLKILGMPQDDAFVPSSSSKRARRGSIYDRYSKADLLDILRDLKRQAVKRCHPDAGGKAEDLIIILLAYDKGVQILSYRV